MEGQRLYAQNYHNHEESMIHRQPVHNLKSVNTHAVGFSQMRLNSTPVEPCPPLSDNRGFTMVELLITMVVFVFVMAAASQIFSGLLTQFKQQSKIAETNIEGVIGLEILRRDIENAGYGLPFRIPEGVSYNEAANEAGGLPFKIPYTPASFNETTVVGTTNPPKAIMSADGAGWNGSDVLVVKSLNVSPKPVAHKWTYLTVDGTKSWQDSSGNEIPSENFNSGDETNDYIIALRTGNSDETIRMLLTDSGSFSKKFNEVDVFTPPDNTEARFIYGINDGPVRMPFNRADYFIVADATVVPQRCAHNPTTNVPLVGVLYKGLINHADGALDPANTLPLLDCVADMQVVYRLDMDDDGIIGTCSNADATTVSDCGDEPEGALLAEVQATFDQPEDLRTRLKEIRVYLLAHEGQRDPNFRYQHEAITVGEFSLGRDFNLKSNIGDPEYQYYRWKLYSLVVNPLNLR